MAKIKHYLLVSKYPIDGSLECVQMAVGMENPPKKGEVIDISKTNKKSFRFTNFGRFDSKATVIKKISDSLYSKAMNDAFPAFLVTFENVGERTPGYGGA